MTTSSNFRFGYALNNIIRPIMCGIGPMFNLNFAAKKLAPETNDAVDDDVRDEDN